MNKFFYHCRDLEYIDVSSFDTRNVTTMWSMFGYSTQLTSVNLNSFDTTKVMQMRYMFDNCINLKNIDMSKATFDNAIPNNLMFNCTANGVTIKVKDEAAKHFLQKELDERKITATIEVVGV